MIKAIFFDIDGTLLSHSQWKIPLDTRRALDELKNKGMKVFAATGRHILELEELPMEDVFFDGYVTLNGQICLDSERNILFGTPVCEKDMEQILPLFEKKEIPMMFVETGRMYMNMVNKNVVDAQNDIATSIPPIQEYTGNPIYQVIAYGDEEELEQISALLGNCRLVRWNKRAADFIPANGGKVRGIEKFLEYYHIVREEVMAFGDGNNDIDMIEFAGIGVAMGNACQEVKACADYVTEDIDEGGVAKALKHFGVCSLSGI